MPIQIIVCDEFQIRLIAPCDWPSFLNTNFVVLSQACWKSYLVADFVAVYHFQDRLSDVRGRVDKTRQVLEGEIQRRQQMRKDLETIRMWVVKIEVLINSKLTKHEEMDEKEIKVCLKGPSQPQFCFSFRCESLAFTVTSENAPTMELSVKLIKIIKKKTINYILSGTQRIVK